MENGPFTDGLPIKNGGSFHGKLLNSQMVVEFRVEKHFRHPKPQEIPSESIGFQSLPGH